MIVFAGVIVIRWEFAIVGVIVVVIIGLAAINITGLVANPNANNQNQSSQPQQNASVQNPLVERNQTTPIPPITGQTTNNTQTTNNATKNNITNRTFTGGGGGGGGGSGGGTTTQPAQPQYNANVFLSPSSKNANVGDTFAVDINLDTTKEIYGYELVLNFDPNVLETTSISEGNFLKKDGATTFPILMTNNTLGEIVVAVIRLGSDNGMSGNGIVATINFKAKNAGTSTLKLKDVSLQNPDATEISDVLVTDGTATVS